VADISEIVLHDIGCKDSGKSAVQLSEYFLFMPLVNTMEEIAVYVFAKSSSLRAFVAKNERSQSVQDLLAFMNALNDRIFCVQNV
jgi:hypothetical protein